MGRRGGDPTYWKPPVNNLGTSGHIWPRNGSWIWLKSRTTTWRESPTGAGVNRGPLLRKVPCRPPPLRLTGKSTARQMPGPSGPE
eukprot:8622578-Heterocapsa_arctica.AAC.1